MVGISKTSSHLPESFEANHQRVRKLRHPPLDNLYDFCPPQALSAVRFTLQEYPNMPVIRNARNRKPPPDGFDDIEDTLLEFANKMKDAENAPHDGKKRHEMIWPIFQITHQRK